LSEKCCSLYSQARVAFCGNSCFDTTELYCSFALLRLLCFRFQVLHYPPARPARPGWHAAEAPALVRPHSRHALPHPLPDPTGPRNVRPRPRIQRPPPKPRASTLGAHPLPPQPGQAVGGVPGAFGGVPGALGVYRGRRGTWGEKGADSPRPGWGVPRGAPGPTAGVPRGGRDDSSETNRSSSGNSGTVSGERESFFPPVNVNGVRAVHGGPRQ